MKSVAKAVGTVMIIMIFSRLMSLVSNSFYLASLGFTNKMEIYSYAISIPNIIFTSFGTAISTAVIPIFAGHIAAGHKDRAFAFANRMINLSVVFTAILSILGILFAPLFIHFTRFRYFEYQEYSFAVLALRTMFPIIVFYALNYIFQGVLQSLGRYNMPAMVSIPSSLVVILYVAFFGKIFEVGGLVVATFIGLSMQALILIPPVLKTGYTFRPMPNIKEVLDDEDIKKALSLIPPVLVGTSAYQINMLFNTNAAAHFKDGATLVTNVQNLILYAVLAFIFSVTAVIFPKFTMLASQNDMENFKCSVHKILKSMVYFLLPATLGFVALRYELIDFVYGWGNKITEQNLSIASIMVAFYAIGITGIGFKEVLDRAFYSLKDTKTPAINGVVMMLTNIAFSLILISVMGVLGIPLAYSAASIVGTIVLLKMIRKKVGSFGGEELLVFTCKIFIASGIMFGVLVCINYILKDVTFSPIAFCKGLKLFLPILAGGSVYTVVTYFLKIEDTVKLLSKLTGMIKIRGI